ncbi:MAG: DNA-3-methyladenine glycosylase [Gemmatimonadaceae bacterium]
MTKNAALSARRSRLTKQRPLPREFYNRETEQVARDLLGAVLECRTVDGVAAGRIVETEAYIGEHDLACHAAAGRTARTAPLYGAPGIAYVYFIYGMYWCVNAVTRAKDEPSAVLIRALEPVSGIEAMRRRRPKARRDVDLTNGPGKLCQALGIDGSLNNTTLMRGKLRILEGAPVADDDVVITPRIGITKCASWPLRYFIAGNAYVSKTPAHFARSAPG